LFFINGGDILFGDLICMAGISVPGYAPGPIFPELGTGICMPASALDLICNKRQG